MRHHALVDILPRSGRSKSSTARLNLDERFADEARFFKTWVDSPGRTGAVSPSGRFLARAMARCVDPHSRGLVLELGPGTGPVTDALIERGVAPERLVLVEFASHFCNLLRKRFPQTRIVQGDAYRLPETLAGVVDAPISAVVSSLPLLNQPDPERLALLEGAFDLMGPDGLFVQFTYGLTSPIPLGTAEARGAFSADVDAPVWLNLPPARVWRYRRADHYARRADAPRRPAVVQAFDQLKAAPALALLRKIADGAKDVARR